MRDILLRTLPKRSRHQGKAQVRGLRLWNVIHGRNPMSRIFWHALFLCTGGQWLRYSRAARVLTFSTYCKREWSCMNRPFILYILQQTHDSVFAMYLREVINWLMEKANPLNSAIGRTTCRPGLKEDHYDMQYGQSHSCLFQHWQRNCWVVVRVVHQP